MKVTAHRARVVWVVTRILFVSIPLSHTIISAVDGKWVDVVSWGTFTILTVTMVYLERAAFRHGLHFGQVMIMWALSHQVEPEEFAEMPDPEPWDLPWHEKEG